jgi:hypothetical protein
MTGPLQQAFPISTNFERVSKRKLCVRSLPLLFESILPEFQCLNEQKDKLYLVLLNHRLRKDFQYKTCKIQVTLFLKVYTLYTYSKILKD